MSDELDTSKIVPLEIGTVWEGILVTSSADSVDSVLSNYEVTDTVSVNGETWYVVNRTDSGEVRFSTLCANRKDGFWFTLVGHDTGAVSKYAALYAVCPATEGQSYQGMGVETVVRVCDLHDTVKVPAGAFECIAYCWDDAESISRGVVYLAPGVGWVREDLTDMFDRSRFTTWELVRIKRPSK